MSPIQIHLSLMFWRMNLAWVINRFSHRPSNIDFDILEIKRAIYRINLLQTIEATDLVISIDEWKISRNTHQKYYWSLKRKKAEIRSIIFDKPVSLISGISSDGWSFTHLHKSTINSSKFKEFLADLKKFILTKWKIKGIRVVIILDNPSSHKAKIWVMYMNENFEVVLFLPPYTPQYAPVDNFFICFKEQLMIKDEMKLSEQSK